MTAARRLLPFAALGGAIVLLHQVSDLVAGSMGADFSTPAGRVRVVVAIAGRSAGFMAGDTLLLWALAGLALARPMRALALVHLVVGLGLLAILPVYMSDTGYLASSVGGAELGLYRGLVVRTLIMCLGMGVVGILAARALGGLAAGRAPAVD